MYPVESSPLRDGSPGFRASPNTLKVCMGPVAPDSSPIQRITGFVDVWSNAGDAGSGGGNIDIPVIHTRERLEDALARQHAANRSCSRSDTRSNRPRRSESRRPALR